MTSRLLVLTCTALCLTLIGGCPPQTNGPDGNNTNTLTDDEQNASRSGTQSAAALASALGIAQNTAPDAGGASNLDLPDLSGVIPDGDNETTFGTCPQVTLANTGGAELSVDLDFAAGCELTGSDGLTCSGGATGTYAVVTQTVNLAFETLSCGGTTLGGDAQFVLGASGDAVTLTGDWDLTLADGGTTYTADGLGDGAYDRQTAQVTIVSFEGTVGDGTTTWAAQAADLAVSWSANGNFIPSAGTITLSGSDIRTLTVEFDANSPSTGQVQVSVNGGTAFTVDLDDL